MKKLKEDAPVNSAGSGAVAGMGVGPQGEPGGKKAKLMKILRRRRLNEVLDSYDKVQDYFDAADKSYNAAKSSGDETTMRKRVKGGKRAAYKNAKHWTWAASQEREAKKLVRTD